MRAAPALDVVVHVRRGDYVDCGWALPFEYYEEAIETFRPPNAQLWIATDDPRDPFFWRFRRWRPEYVQADDRATIAIMVRTPVLIMSRSSYSWWPAILSDGGTAVCPEPSSGFWAKSPATEIDLVDHDRFRCLKCEGTYSLTAVEQAYQTWRVASRRLTARVNRQFGTKFAIRN